MSIRIVQSFTAGNSLIYNLQSKRCRVMLTAKYHYICVCVSARASSKSMLMQTTTIEQKIQIKKLFDINLCYFSMCSCSLHHKLQWNLKSKIEATKQQTGKKWQPPSTMKTKINEIHSNVVLIVYSSEMYWIWLDSN